MDEAAIQATVEELDQRDTKELLKIWRDRENGQSPGEVIEATRLILEKRGVNLLPRLLVALRLAAMAVSVLSGVLLIWQAYCLLGGDDPLKAGIKQAVFTSWVLPEREKMAPDPGRWNFTSVEDYDAELNATVKRVIYYSAVVKSITAILLILLAYRLFRGEDYAGLALLVSLVLLLSGIVDIFHLDKVRYLIPFLRRNYPQNLGLFGVLDQVWSKLVMLSLAGTLSALAAAWWQRKEQADE